jgi:hypothetical protein
LQQAGLITRSRAAQMRPCKLEPAALKGVDEWLGDYRLLWERRLDRLEDYLKVLQANGADAKEGHRGRKK